MERRKFLIGAGSAALGTSALVGSGAFSLVASERTASVRIAHDSKAYLGLKRGSGPNRSYVDYDEKGHLQIRMDETNPNVEKKRDDFGTGVNSNSLTVFNNLFQIHNNGKQKIAVFIFKKGQHADRVGFYTDAGNPCWGTVLDVGQSTDVGMLTWTKGIKTDTQLLDNVWLVAIGLEEFGGAGDGEMVAASSSSSEEMDPSEQVPEDAEPNDELPGDA